MLLNFSLFGHALVKRIIIVCFFSRACTPMEIIDPLPPVGGTLPRLRITELNIWYLCVRQAENIPSIIPSISSQNQQIPVSFTFPCSPSAVWLDWPPGRYSTCASSSRPRSLLSRHPSAFLGRWHKSDHKWPKTGHHVGCPWKWYYVYQLKSTNHKGKKMNILFLFIYKYFSHQLHLK